MSGRFYDASGAVLTLGNALGRGGEGSVFAASGALAAKVYTNGGAVTHAAKLAVLAAFDDPAVREAAAWPNGLVYDENRRVAGYVMPRLDGFRPIAMAYNPAARKLWFPQAGWGWLAHVGRNLSVATATVHAAGFVIGDLNESNVLVASDARVRLIDVDSFQVTHGGSLFPCNVATPMYQPPELQGKTFAGLQRTPNHDRFGLAVLIFQLLFMGRHPWAGRYVGKGELSFENGDHIARLPFAYGRAAKAAGLRPSDDGVRTDWLPESLASLFEDAFGGSQFARPDGRQWTEALDELERGLVRCKSAPIHQYPQAMKACPWCRLDNAGFLFFVVGSPAVIRESLDIGDIEARLQSIPSFAGPPAVPAQRAAIGEPIAAHLVRHARLWYAEITGSTVAAFCAAHWLAVAWALGVTVALIVAIVLTRPPLRPVRVARRQRLVEAQQRYEEAWNEQQRVAISRRIDARKQELSDMLARYKALPAKYVAERQALERDRYHLQLEAFLEEALVSQAGLWKIGRRTRAALGAFGIETAKDVEQRLPLLEIPGLGRRKRDALERWVAGLKRKFQYDPRQPLNHAILAALGRREAEERSTLERHLRGGPRALASDAEATFAELEHVRERLDDAARLLVQSQADYAMLRRL